jgi:general nucleoside transport system permease protein
MLMIKKRLVPERHLKFTMPLISVALSFFIGGLIFLLNGVNPFSAISSMFISVFGSFYGISETLLFSVPIALCAIGIGVAANMKIWNIGAEGQFVLGAFGASLAALYLHGMPPAVVIIMMFMSGIFFSALSGLIAGILKAVLNANEILVTLMFNYISILFVLYLVYGPWKGKDNFPYTQYFPDYTFMPTLFSTRLHVGIFAVIFIAVIMYFIIKRTVWGYQIRVVGESVEAARYAAIPVRRNIVLILAISGAIAGIGGIFEVAGLQHRLQPSITQGYGFTGIIVAWLAKNNMLLILPVSFLIAGLFTAGQDLQMFYKIPSSIVKVFQGIILVCVLGGDIFIDNRLVLEKKNA